jgi:Trypsin-like peptidase domain
MKRTKKQPRATPYYEVGHALQSALGAVVTVGHGRGFVVEGRGRFGSRGRYVITAAHCLPFVPPRHGASLLEGRTYEDLIAPLSDQPPVWCECLFLDPIADVAVLGAPDNQEMSKLADAYEALVEATIPLTVAEPPSEPIPEEVAHLADMEKQSGATGQVEWATRQCRAFLLSLNNQWFPCMVRHAPNGMLSIYDAANGIAGGMSGSPIIAENGTAIGIVCTATELPDTASTEGGPNPRLMGNLPGWFLKILADGAE